MSIDWLTIILNFVKVNFFSAIVPKISEHLKEVCSPKMCFQFLRMGRKVINPKKLSFLFFSILFFSFLPFFEHPFYFIYLSAYLVHARDPKQQHGPGQWQKGSFFLHGIILHSVFFFHFYIRFFTFVSGRWCSHLCSIFFVFQSSQGIKQSRNVRMYQESLYRNIFVTFESVLVSNSMLGMPSHFVFPC